MRGTTTYPLPDWVGVIILLPVIYVIAIMLLKIRHFIYKIDEKSIQIENSKYLICEIKYYEIISVKEINYLEFFTMFMLLSVKKTFVETVFMNVVLVKTTSGNYIFSPVVARLFVEQVRGKLEAQVQ